MLNVIDTYLLKSGMPKEELCVIRRSKRAFYYFGIVAMILTAIVFGVLGFIKIFG